MTYKIKLFKVNLFAIAAMLMMSAGFSTNVSAVEFGEIEPCTADRIYCDWNGPLLWKFYYDDCPNCTDCADECPMFVEHYWRSCGGTFFELQIVRLYAGEAEGDENFFTCNNCTQDRWNEAYVKLFKLYYDSYPSSQFDHIVQQKSCKKYVGPTVQELSDPSFVPGAIDTLFVDVASIINPGDFPWQPDPDDIMPVPVTHYWEVCDTECCCYEVEIQEVNDEIEAIFTTDPCSSNVSYECPEDCQGGCEDLEFWWDKNMGMFLSKQSPGVEFEIPSEIKIIPNPNSGDFSFNFSNELSGELKLIVNDLQGNSLQELIFDKDQSTINANVELTNVPNGTYILRFELNGVNAGTKKIIIKK